MQSNGRTSGERTLSRTDAFLFRIETVFNFVAALGIVFLMLLGVVQVVGRSAFNAPVPGYVDVVEQAMAVFAFLGIAYCQKLGGHIRMEMVLTRFKGRSLWLAEAATILASLAIVTVLVPNGFDHFLRAYQIGDSTIDLEWPIWPSKLLVPIAFSLLWLRLLLQFVGFVRLSMRPAAEPIAVPLIARLQEQARREIEDALGRDYAEQQRARPQQGD